MAQGFTASDASLGEVTITEPALLIRIARLWDPGMSDDELYDATRGHWRIGKKRDEVELAMAVAEGIVREVYTIASWHRAGSTPSRTSILGEAPPDRWEFTGAVADETTRSKYVDHSVKHYFPKGSQTPFRYVLPTTHE